MLSNWRAFHRYLQSGLPAICGGNDSIQTLLCGGPIFPFPRDHIGHIMR